MRFAFFVSLATTLVAALLGEESGLCNGKCSCRDLVMECSRVQLELSEFANLPVELIEISIYRSNISHIPSKAFQRFRNLQILKIEFSHVHTISDEAFASLNLLETLDLKSNNIRELTEKIFKPLVRLQVLNLRSNNLNTIPPSVFKFLPRLRYLNLRENNVSKMIEFERGNLPELWKLDLSDNKISELKPNFVAPLNSLRHLSLSNNVINYVDILSFKSLQNLEYLDLSWNQLSYLDPNAFSTVPHLVQLYIGGNDFICDCNLQPLKRWIEAKHLITTTWKINPTCEESRRCHDVSPQCASPSLYKNSFLTHLASSLFTCTTTTTTTTTTTAKPTSKPDANHFKLREKAYKIGDIFAEHKLAIVLGVVFVVIFVTIIAIVVCACQLRTQKKRKRRYITDTVPNLTALRNSSSDIEKTSDKNLIYPHDHPIPTTNIPPGVFQLVYGSNYYAVLPHGSSDSSSPSNQHGENGLLQAAESTNLHMDGLLRNSLLNVDINKPRTESLV